MSQIFSDQVTASILQESINRKELEMVMRLVEVQKIASEKMLYAQTALRDSLQCVENVRDFISDPSHILGSMHTKHGEIAEHIEVEIRNGRDILNNLKPGATFEGVARTAPEDYIIDGAQVQSKFINGGRKSLEHVLGHIKTYPKFTENGYYHIPKNQYKLINKIACGERVDGLRHTTVQKYKEIIQQIENETGKSFTEVVRPGLSNYNDVQLGTVDKTLNSYEAEFKDTHAKDVRAIRNERELQSEQAKHITDPSWGEAIKYSAVAAVIGGITSSGIKIYSKIHSGRKISEFSIEDWMEVGYDFTKGGLKGGISGLGIYGLTNLGNFAAPFAGAVVSTAMGIASLASDYRNGNISKVDFSESACALSVEAGLSAVGAALGQTIIPIPVLGAIIGTASAKACLEISKCVLGKSEQTLIDQMQKGYDSMVASLSKETYEIILEMDRYYAKLDGFIEAALSKCSAVRFYGSIELCRFLRVPEDLIIHTTKELDNFMLL